MAWNTVCNFWSGSRWSRNCFNRYTRWLHILRIKSTWSTKLKVLWNITPRNLADCTYSIPSKDLGNDQRLGWGLCKTISLVFWKLITIPLLSAHSRIFENSLARSTLVFSGTKRLVSSAYLNNKFTSGEAKNDFQYVGWNSYDHDIDFVRWLHPAMWHVALESWQWIHQVATLCNVIRGSGMTCHWIRPNVRHIGILHLVSISTQHRSRRVIFYQSAKFCPNRTTLGRKKWHHVDFQDGGSQPSWIIGI